MIEFGRELARLMAERGIGVRQLARAMYVNPGHISNLCSGKARPSMELAEALDKHLGAGGTLAAIAAHEGAGKRTASRTGHAGLSRATIRDVRDRDTASEALDVMTWVTGTNASDDEITELARITGYLAEAHTRMPATKILPEILGAHRAAHGFLRGGRQRLSQAHELLRIDSALLAHACLLFGDLGQYEAARAYGSASLLCAQEAEADEGLAWTAMAKTARWQDRFTEAAGLARRGYQVSERAAVRVELAYREANAIALFGDVPRARDALVRAARAAEDLNDDGTTAWSFSRGRQAIFTLSVCVHTGDPDGALRAADMADAYWDNGGGRVTATWAQIRAGAAAAHLLKDSLDGAAAQLGPVLELPPEQRIRTITGYLAEISGMLREPRFAGSPLAAGLAEQISQFSASAIPAGTKP